MHVRFNSVALKAMKYILINNNEKVLSVDRDY